MIATLQNIGAGDGAGGGGKVSGTRQALRRLWQVPLLIAGVIFFVMGIRAVVKTIRYVPFETQVEGVHAILKAGKYQDAIKQLNILGEYYTEKSQVLQLQCLAGDTYYYAGRSLEREGGASPAENWKYVDQHYRQAVLLGAKPTSLMNERWGDAAMAMGDAKLAVEKYEAAAAVARAGGEAGPNIFRTHAKELITAYLSLERPDMAEDVLDRFLAENDLDVNDRSWSLCKRIELAMAYDKGVGGEVGRGVGGGKLEKAVASAIEAVKSMPENDPGGRVLYWVGRAEFERGLLDQAKQHLEAARKRFLSRHLDDGRAELLLGKIAQIQNDFPAASTLYDDVIRGDAGTVIWAAARLGRAEIAALGGVEGGGGQITDQMTADYRYVIKTLLESEAPKAKPENLSAPSSRPEFVTLDQVRSSLVAMYQRYNGQDRMEEALRFLMLQGEMKEKETPAFVWRLATTREKLANQWLKGTAASGAKGDGAEARKRRAAKEADAREWQRLAAEDYVRHARITTMEDAVSAESYWKAAQLFDAAGETVRSIEIYDKFVRERPRDPRVPEALLAVGRLYQSVGKLDQAIAYFKRNIDTNPHTPAAYESTVSLARCYMALGPDYFAAAESTLFKIVQNNPDVDPTANEFRASLFALGELYYRSNNKWREAILRLEEFIGRYPTDHEIPRAQFLLAESYRKSAAEIDAFDKNPLPQDKRGALEQARIERLMKAADLFGGVIGLLDAEAENQGSGALSDLEETMLRASYMDRAGCYFAAGDYAMAIKLYDLAATRFSQDITAADAYVQIINSYAALQQSAEARAAAERGWWIVKRIPDEAFGKTGGPVPLTRKFYEDFLAMRRSQK
ncbi:MAG: tetratricopeptide repeat protein [Phycisphaerales bacterium]|nr:tetratricopeptide repeat protein [Phycisphaerales bacterium]